MFKKKKKKPHTDAIQFLLGLNYFVPGPIQDVAQIQCRAWLFCWRRREFVGVNINIGGYNLYREEFSTDLIEHTSMQQVNVSLWITIMYAVKLGDMSSLNKSYF